MNFLDLHCDTASKAFNEGKSLMSNDLAVDITRAENVGADCFFAVWSVYEEHESPFEYAVKVIKFIKSCRPNSLISIEGGDVLEGRIENVKKLKAMGVKILTVAWNGVNQVCSGAISGTGEGLTSFGFSAVRELENNEIVVDCSHLNERGFYDLLKTARKPFCATHSNAFAVTPHPRNLTDAQIREIAKIGGIIGLCPYSLFVGGNSIENFLAHAEHVLKVSKTDKILAIGSDFDGMPTPIKEFSSVSDFPLLREILIRRFGKETAERMLFRNAAEFLQLQKTHKNIYCYSR